MVVLKISIWNINRELSAVTDMPIDFYAEYSYNNKHKSQ